MVCFFIKHWTGISQLLLIIVSLSAVGIYIAQEKGKIKDAASLVVLQIDELMLRVLEIQKYVTDQGLNFSAFYESLPLMNTNYWSQYKHLFIRKIDINSYNTIDKFYNYLSCMQEQQQLLHQLQRNYFFVKQTAIANTEFMLISETLKEVEGSLILPEQLKSLLDSLPKESEGGKNTEVLSKLLQQIQKQNPDFDMDLFWALYQKKRQRFLNITNQDSLTPYTPMQISTTLQSILKQYALLEVVGTQGYKKLQELAGMSKK